jgi:glutathione S-transferase
MANPNPYHLFLSPRSPFARRVRLALRRLDLSVIEHPLNVLESNPDLEAANPLGLVPALVLPDGRALSDSSAILESLHDLYGGLWPEPLTDRIEVRQASTLATGLMQAAVSFFQETRMHEVPSRTWAQDHWNTVHRTLRHLEPFRSDLWFRSGELTQAGWDLACALEYLEFRMPECRDSIPSALVATLELARRSALFRETAPRL